MAEEEPILTSPPTQDVAHHVADYASFTKLLKWGAIICLVVGLFWMLIVKATSLLSLLQIADIVLWADRLGAPNFLPSVGLVHDDWRWRYYLVLFVFYILVTWLSERAFEAIMRRAGRGILSEVPA